jgi:hypothetical protein
MELMIKLARVRHGGLIVGALNAIFVGIAVFALGAPPLILLPATLIVGTAYLELRLRVNRRLDRH